MNYKNRFLRMALTAVCACLVLLACDDYADETYELSAHDAAAVRAMDDTLEVGLTMERARILNANSEVGVILIGETIDTVIAAIDVNGLTLSDIYGALTSINSPSFGVNDTAYAVIIGVDSLAYRMLSLSEAGTYYLYTNHHIGSALYSVSDFSKIAFTSDDMSPELIAGLFDGDGLPIMKARYEYELPAGEYLFEIARVEATISSNFRVVFLRG